MNISITTSIDQPHPNLEADLNFREAMESINFGVKYFLRGEKSVVFGAIKLILNFVSHDKSSSSTIKQSCSTMYFNAR